MTKRTASIYPSVEEINALPEKFRQYIHDLETRCDKSGDVQSIALLREDRDALQRRVEELEAEKKRKRKQNPNCSVPGCKAKAAHEDDPDVSHFMQLRTHQPAILAGHALTGLNALKDSIVRDVDEDNIFAWFTRSRQVEELYVGAVYALLVAKEDEIPHFFSEKPPNGLGYFYKQTNEIAFAGKGRLHMTSDEPDLRGFRVLDLFNQTAHVSFFSQFLVSAFYRFPERKDVANALVEGVETYCHFLQIVVKDFALGRTRDEVLRTLRFEYEHLP